ncbi:acyl-CoA dehydrogenase family protein [Pseudenhygromyxa sp. WMMC2535]|nr:acyl-CoA dehydrogenase family protein [Pseudenhygromyxa sp. WMMC2535]
MQALKIDPDDREAFAAHCRAWLRDNLPPRPDFALPQGPLEIAERRQLDYLCTWQAAAYRAGLVGCDYPEAYGGGGRHDCQRIANREMQAAGAPFLPNVVGLGMAGPTIVHHGSEALKRELIPRLLSGEDIWCQGFSEPGAGSDLANVQTFAERKGDRWIINGHKIWTSLAHFAQWMILLCRSDRGNKYGGMTYFVVPIASALERGVSVRPLIKMTGEGGFNEVLFEDFEIDDRYRLDEVGRGWSVAMTTLAHERGAGSLVTPTSGGAIGDSPDTLTAAGLIALAKTCYRAGKPAADDPVLRDAIVAQLIRHEAFAHSQRRAKVPALCDHPARLPLQHKLLLSEQLQDTARLACTIAGQAASLHHSEPSAPGGGRWPLAYMNSYGFTIAAGSNEIQRNILGERVLGLAKSK